MAYTRGGKTKKGTSDDPNQVAAVHKAPEDGTSSQQGAAAIANKAPKKGRSKKPNPAPAADGVAPKRGRGRPRKITLEVRDSVEPEVVNKKLKAIADIEDKAAAAYADDTTPGGVAGKLPAKKDGAGRRAAPKGKVKQAVIADSSDLSELESGLDTDIEGTVRRKGKGKAQSYRMAIQALREQPLILESVAEDEEAGTAATCTEPEQQPIKGIKDKATEQGEEGHGNNNKGVSVGNLSDRDPTKEDRKGRAKSATRASTEKGAVNTMDEGDDEIEFIRETPPPQDRDGDVDMEGMVLIVTLWSSGAD